MKNTWFEMSGNERSKVKYELTKWILKQRLSEVGYDHRDFKNMSSFASRLRKYIKYRGINIENNYGTYTNLLVSPSGEFALIVNENFNEEYIDLLKKLCEAR